AIDDTVAVTLVIAADVLLYVTIPLHARLLYVLLRPGTKMDLDGAFHTLMINTTIVNLLFALDCCFILEPSASGVFFEFYNVGEVICFVDYNNCHTLFTVGSILHLVLAMNRFSAISFPLKHQKWWRGRKLFWFCVVLWTIGFCFCIPLFFPGTTSQRNGINLYGVDSVEYTFLGPFFLIYSVKECYSIFTISGQAIQFFFLLKFILNALQKYTKSGAAEIKRMTRGVLRTTLAALCISVENNSKLNFALAGSWILVIFMFMIYISLWMTGIPILLGNYFSSIFRFLNAVNNILTPWTMLVAFNNVR
ncbi:hypothetical protein PFISCL1PPCAC_4476, partial [Pristionchus fissidentatus]